MRIGTTALTAAMFALSFTRAYSADQTAIISGAGAGSCASFAQNYKADTSIELLYYSWAEGFMSGMNAVLDVEKAPTRDLGAWSREDTMAHIREYCDVHPLQQYTTAVASFYDSLPKVPPEK